jgi:hypothetical protein
VTYGVGYDFLGAVIIDENTSRIAIGAFDFLKPLWYLQLRGIGKIGAAVAFLLKVTSSKAKLECSSVAASRLVRWNNHA